MKGRWLGAHRVELPACGSTNDEAARLARAGASHGTIVLAHEQTAGRGRDGRPWASPPGAGLYLSAVLRPPLPLAMVPPMTLAVGLGVCDAARASGAIAQLKWPNDVFVEGRKLAGVLVEAQSQGPRLEAVIVGIGVNLGGDLPAAIAGSAITLAEAARRGGAPAPDRAAFLASLLDKVESWLDRYTAGGLAAIVPAWRARMAPGLRARATVGGLPIIGELTGMAEDGALVLRDGAGVVHTIRSGDVEVIRPTPITELLPGPAVADRVRAAVVLPPAG